MARRTRGEGSIVQRKDGRWQGSLQVAGVRRTVYGRTRSEVAGKLQELKREARGGLPNPGKRTVADLCSAWLEMAAPNLRPKTLADYQHLVEKHVVPTIGGVKLSRLEPVQVERLLVAIQSEGHRRMAQRVWSVMHRACVFGVRWKWLADNPLDRVQRPKYRPPEQDVWTAEQVETFVQSVQQGQAGQYSYLLGFLLASGCRIGEALGLRWGDVDFAACSVRIERQVVDVAGALVESAPKTQAGQRGIVLPSWGMALLRAQRAQVATWRLQSGCAQAWDERVFPSRAGTVPGRRNVLRALYRLCDDLGLPRVKLHGLRHLSLSLLADQGVPPKTVQRRAGHASVQTTLALYVHALSDADQRAADKLEKWASGQ